MTFKLETDAKRYRNHEHLVLNGPRLDLRHDINGFKRQETPKANNLNLSYLIRQSQWRLFHKSFLCHLYTPICFSDKTWYKKLKQASEKYLKIRETYFSSGSRCKKEKKTLLGRDTNRGIPVFFFDSSSQKSTDPHRFMTTASWPLDECSWLLHDRS